MASYDKTIPAGSTAFPTVDDNIRSNQDAVEERLSAEHQFPSNPFTANTSGRHKFGVGTTATRDATLTAPLSGMVWYNTSHGAWQIHNGSAWLSAGNSGVGTTAARNALTSVPTNFTWLSTDEGFTSYYNGTIWVTLASKGLFHGRVSWASISTLTIGRGNAAKLRIEVDGVLTESAADLTVDLTSADREDTSGSGGSASETASTWYYVYVANVSGVPVEHISFTAPVMDPASGKVGYHPGTGNGLTTWRCIGAVFNNSGSDIQPFYVNADGWWVFRTTPTASPFTQTPGDPSALTSYTSLAFTAGFPQTARAGRFHVFQSADAAGQSLHIAHEAVTGTIAATRGFVELQSGAGGGSGRDTGATVMFDLPIDATPTLKYGVEGAYTDFTVLRFRVLGWLDDFGLVK